MAWNSEQRLEVLKLAVDKARGNDNVISLAEKFLAFVEGTPDEETKTDEN